MTDQANAGYRSGNCECESSKLTFDGNGSLCVSSLDDQREVMAIFSRHFNEHSLIPDRNGLFRSPGTIHRDCSNEMYVWCKSRNYFRLWAYLYTNWYKNEQWVLWARSNCAQEIPILRTTQGSNTTFYTVLIDLELIWLYGFYYLGPFHKD